MGDRASYAIRSDGKTEVFYADFGAATLLADIFWGPEACEAQIRKEEPTDGWLDDVFGEAAVALCKDTRTVAFYDCRYHPATVATAARMMRTLWPGWTVVPAIFVSGVAATLSIDLVAAAEPSFYFDHPTALDAFGPFEPGELPRAGLVHLDRAGTRTALAGHHALLPLLAHGPALLDALPGLPRLADALAALGTEPDASGEVPVLLATAPGGSVALVHIDADAKRLSAVALQNPIVASEIAAVHAISERWPGWQLTVRMGTVEEYFRDLGEPVPGRLVGWDEDPPLADQLEDLARRLLGHDAFVAEATTWLAGVGLPATPPAAHDLDAGERARLFTEALRALDLSEDEVRAVLAAGASVVG